MKLAKVDTSLNYLGSNATLERHVSAVRRPYPVEGRTHRARPRARNPPALHGRRLTQPQSRPTARHCPRRRPRQRGPALSGLWHHPAATNPERPAAARRALVSFYRDRSAPPKVIEHDLADWRYQPRPRVCARSRSMDPRCRRLDIRPLASQAAAQRGHPGTSRYCWYSKLIN